MRFAEPDAAQKHSPYAAVEQQRPEPRRGTAAASDESEKEKFERGRRGARRKEGGYTLLKLAEASRPKKSDCNHGISPRLRASSDMTFVMEEWEGWRLAAVKGQRKRAWEGRGELGETRLGRV